MKLSEMVKQRREERDITKAELAKLVGASPALITYIEDGTKIPSLALTVRLASALGCSLDYLVFGKSA